MYELDAAITQAINALAGKSVAIDAIMLWASAIGVPLLVLAVAAQWWRKPDRLHIRHALVATGLSFLLGLFLNQLILLFIQRMRPYQTGLTHLLIDPSTDFSFPSDHSTASFAIASAFLFNGMWRVGLWFLAIAVIISLSRVYIGTHYISDVLGGALTGFLAACIIKSTYREGSRIDRLVTGIL
ncbi:MAG: phosphatase PAP2 family protein [Rhizobiaceae bacterium]|nr:phosphatase PAP2 family protein [Rhizobiaceae bacterium]